MAWGDPFAVQAPAPAEEESSFLGDTWSSVKSGFQSGVVEPVLASGRARAEEAGYSNVATIMKNLGASSAELAEENLAAMSPQARKALEAGVLSKEFMEHPLRASWFKMANATPGFASMVAPAMLAPGGALGAAIVNAGAGGLGASGAVVSQLYKETDKLDDAQLAAQAPKFRELLDQGMDPAQARIEFNKELRGNAEWINALVGGAAGVIGPAGQVVRGLKGGTAAVGAAERGALARAGIGAAEGGGAMAAQGAVGDVSVQTQLMGQALQDEFDAWRAANAGAEGALLGGPLGAAAGGAFRGARTGRDPQVGQQPKGAGTGTPVRPVESADAGNPQSAPARSAREYPTEGEALPKAPQVDVAPVLGPDATQSVATVGEAAPARTATAPEVTTPPVSSAPPVGPRVRMFRPGETEPAIAQGMERIETPQGSFHFDPQQINPLKIRLAAQQERLGELLGPERVPAPEIRPEPVPTAPEIRPQAVEPPRMAAGEILPVPGVETLKAPEKPILAEPASPPPAETPAAPRVLPSLTDEAAKVATERAQATAVAEEKPVRDHDVKRTARKAEDAGKANKIVQDMVPDDQPIPTTKDSKAKLQEQLQAMVDRRTSEGIEVPEKKVRNRDPAIILLRDAETLLDKMKAGTDKPADIAKYMRRATDVKRGAGKEMAAERAAEIDQNTRRGKAAKEGQPEEVDRVAAPEPETPEEAFDRKRYEERVERAAALREQNAPETKAENIKQKIEARRKEGYESTPVYTTKAAPVVTRRGNLKEMAPKVGAKVIDLKQRLATAAKDVERKPTDAQKEAGNYAKGHVNFQGLDVTIENPRGSTRSGKDAGGKEWSVTMPDHYGYVKRTKGADGDQVDVYIGKNPASRRVFVVDQVDAKTRKFDEHKAMIGYPDQAAAEAAYKAGFSDGKGAARLGGITEMSMVEFKNWLEKGDTKKRLAESDEDITREVFAMEDRRPLADEKGLAEILDSGEKFDSVYQTTAGEALKSLDFSHLQGLSKELVPFVQRRMRELVGDVEVHVVTEAEMSRASGRQVTDDGGVPRGMWAVTHGGKEYIALRADAIRDPKDAAHILVHEAVHAATVKALNADPSKKAQIRRLMDAALQVLPDDLYNRTSYAFKNEHEFIAEALSNPETQAVLSRLPVPQDVVKALKLDQSRRLSLWDAMITTIRKFLRLPEGSHTMLDAVLRVTDELTAPRRREIARSGELRTVTRHFLEDPPKTDRDFANVVREAISDKINDIVRPAQERTTIFLRAMSNDMLAQYADRFWQAAANPVRKVADLIEIRRTSKQKLQDADTPVIQRALELSRKYAGEQWSRYENVVQDSTYFGVYPNRALTDQPKGVFRKKQDGTLADVASQAWAKARHKELAAEYDQLPAELKQFFDESMRYYADRQGEMAYEVARNHLLKALGLDFDNDPVARKELSELADRIVSKTTTDADADLLGKPLLDIINQAGVLNKLNAPYAPMMRRGDYALIGKRVVEAPTKAIEQVVGDDGKPISAWDFADRQDAIDYAVKQKLRTDVDSIWVDKNTGKRFVTDKDGTEVRISPQDTDAAQRWRVTVQDKHVSFHKTAKEAQRTAAAYVKDGLMEEPSVQARQFQPNGRNADLLSAQMLTLMRSLEQREGYKAMSDGQKAELRNTLGNMSVMLMGSGRIQSKSLPRRYVAGASTDFVNNMHDYSRSSVQYLASLRMMPALEKASQEMRQTVRGDYNKDLARSRIANILEERLWNHGGVDEDSSYFAPAVNRALSVSFLKHLASPAYSAIQTVQPAMLTTPYLAARHGVAKTVREMITAYNDVGGLTVTRQGIRDTARKFRDPSAGLSPMIEGIVSRAAKTDGEREFFQYIIDRGALDRDAGLEISELVQAKTGVWGKVDRGIGWAEGFARALPRAMEAINRGVTGLAAYRLELARTGDHAKAMRYGQEAISNTQFLYSNSNMPSFFNKHPLLRLAFQFKKFGFSMYGLIGREIGRVIHNAEPGDRAEGLRALAGLAATHVALAGALGLPTEPARVLMTAAKITGMSDKDWDDVEFAFREAMAHLLGKTGGEVASRGITRLIGGGFAFDLSARVGAENPLIFGEPKSNKGSDIKAWFFDMGAGAAGSTAYNLLEGGQALSAGEYLKAAEKFAPLKALENGIRAYRQGTEGKRGPSGRELSQPYSWPEAGVRAFGFTPAREAEEGARARTFKQKEAGEREGRTRLQNAWVNAKTAAEKDAAQKAINKWNREQPEESKITPKDLATLAKRRKADEAASIRGIKVNRRTEGIQERLDEVYNIR